MPKKSLITAAIILALALASLLRLSTSSANPPYRSKPLTYWLEGYNQMNYRVSHPEDPQPPTESDANDAVRNAGGKAIPMLLRMLDQPTPSLADHFFKLLSSQHFFKISPLPDNHALKALMGFQALGPAATNALPALIKMFDANHSSFEQRAIPLVFASIGPPARDAVPSLLRALPERPSEVKYPIIRALTTIHAELALVVPALQQCLTDADIQVRSYAARGLGTFGRDAKPAIPALLILYREEAGKPDAYPFAAFEATNAINRIDPDALKAVQK